MTKKMKLIVLNIVIAVICVGIYVLFIPHAITTENYTKELYNATVTIIPLSKKEIVQQSIIIFVLIMLPTIICVVKKIFNPYKWNKNRD